MIEKKFEKIIKELIEFKKEIDNNPEIQQKIIERGEYYQNKYGSFTKDILDILVGEQK